MTLVEFIVPDRSGIRPPREVPIHLTTHLTTQIRTDTDCKTVARAIIYSMPLEALFFIEAVRVQVSDSTGVFSVYDLARELSAAKSLVYGVHMPAFWCALVRRAIA
jgi:hypothetical protein